MIENRAINFQKAYGMNAFIKEQAYRNLYGGSDVWSFNPYREVDEDSEYTDADAELDWDIRNDPDYDSHTYVEDE